MDFVTSGDGTRIAFEMSGTGPPIVLLSGACQGAKAWASVAGLLAPERTVYAVDRRGRGASTDEGGGDFAVAREIDDVRAVLEDIGPAELFGHSSGALLALRVAMTGVPVTGLTLYEPPIFLPGGRDTRGITDRLIGMLAAGDRDTALTTFLTDAVGLEERVAATMRRTPFWPASIALAHTLPYDTRLREESGLDGLAELNLPSLLLVGERSSREFHNGAETLNATIPGSRLRVLPGQTHNAMREGPDLLATAVLGNSG